MDDTRKAEIREVGIVGFGRCGRLAAEILAEHAQVTVTDRIDLSREAASLGVGWGELSTVAAKPFLLLVVPIRFLPRTLDAVAPHLARGALVVDTGSVKMLPLRWMAERLPALARPVGTHPLFGPDSARVEGVRGRRIVVCPAPGHEDAASEVEGLAREVGLEPIRAEAEEHDRAMAHSQAIVFLLSRAMARAGLGPAVYGTPSEERLWSALSLVAGDSDELYRDILGLNPYARDSIARLGAALRAEIERLGGAETRWAP